MAATEMFMDRFSFVDAHMQLYVVSGHMNARSGLPLALTDKKLTYFHRELNNFIWLVIILCVPRQDLTQIPTKRDDVALVVPEFAPVRDLSRSATDQILLIPFKIHIPFVTRTLFISRCRTRGSWEPALPHLNVGVQISSYQGQIMMSQPNRILISP